MEYIHPIQFFYELLRDGKIRIAKKIQKTVTVQDPCSIVRSRGLGEMIRYIVRATCEDFKDVNPRFEHNYCCSAGSGVINYGSPWKFIRMEAGRVKLKQFNATGASMVVAPCHSCHKTIEELIHYYKADMNVMFTSELLAQTMEIPEEMRVEKTGS